MQVAPWHEVTAGILFLAAYALIASEKVDKTKVALIGAGLMILLGIVSQHEAFGETERVVHSLNEFAEEYEPPDAVGDAALAHESAPSAEEVERAAAVIERSGLAEVPGVDWNTIFLLVGMMIFVGITSRTGVFEWVAIKSARLAKGRPIVILCLLCVVTAVLSAFLDNVTTVLLIGPVTILVAEALALDPIPMLIAEALASNIGGTATLIGDPPNILIGSRAGFAFNDFLINLGPLVLVLLALYVVYLTIFWRRDMTTTDARRERLMEMDASKAIRSKPLLVRSGVVGAMILTGFVLHNRLGMEPATIALSGAALLLLVSGLKVEEAFESIEWSTIFFFIGLFIMVGGLVKVGLIERLSRIVLAEFGDNTSVLAIVVLWFSAVASAVVDNIPYVATMCPLVNDVATQLTGEPALEAARDPAIFPIWWSLSLGACLGGNGTLVGASANVVMCGLSKRQGHPISFMRFARAGLPVMLWTVALSTLYVWVRYLR
ncbi:MAG: hypothetical protein GF320_22185 [Armatimonadia bacterium]|nr:hypothetical protein [Armatimonadia bacterium]